MGFNDTSLIRSGHFGNSKENIVIVENFIDSKDLDKIQDFCKNLNSFNSIPGDPWDNRVCGDMTIKQINPEISAIVSRYQNQLKNIIENRFNVLLNNNVPYIVAWRVGDGQAPHADKELPDGTPNNYPGNDIASLMYLTDEYSGGEIYFPNQNLTIRPKVGSAIFFPGDKEYLHGVNTVAEGIRFTSPAFWNIIKLL